MPRPLILLSNDDGFRAPGLHVLMRLALRLGDVLAVAPDRPRSATSHALTMQTPISVRAVSRSAGCSLYACSGFPADCIKFALYKLADRTPDLILSGINHGENASCSAIYSGTVAVATEGCMHSVPAIAFSCINPSQQADLAPYLPLVDGMIEQVLMHGLPPKTCLNVNIPDVPASCLKGVRFCRAARGYWQEEFIGRRTLFRKFYTLSGRYVNLEPDAEETDAWANAHGYVSVVPLQVDMTDLGALSALKASWADWKFSAK